LGDKIKNNQMDGTCSTDGGKDEVHTRIWAEDLTERDHLVDPGVDGRVILKWNFKK
jgi:hypothetical protein